MCESCKRKNVAVFVLLNKSVIPLTEFLEEWNDDDADVKSKCHLQSLRFSDNSTSMIAADVERVI